MEREGHGKQNSYIDNQSRGQDLAIKIDFCCVSGAVIELILKAFIL